MIEIAYRHTHLCENCNKESIISPDLILPAMEHIYTDEILYWKAKCPYCNKIRRTNDIHIPIDIKKELIEKYSGGLATVIENIWYYEEEKRRIEEKLAKLYLEAEEVKKNGDKTRLFPNWVTNDELIQHEIKVWEEWEKVEKEKEKNKMKTFQ